MKRDSHLRQDYQFSRAQRDHETEYDQQYAQRLVSTGASITAAIILFAVVVFCTWGLSKLPF